MGPKNFQRISPHSGNHTPRTAANGKNKASSEIPTSRGCIFQLRLSESLKVCICILLVFGQIMKQDLGSCLFPNIHLKGESHEYEHQLARSLTSQLSWPLRSWLLRGMANYELRRKSANRALNVFGVGHFPMGTILFR